jgi:hypothetical protein
MKKLQKFMACLLVCCLLAALHGLLVLLVQHGGNLMGDDGRTVWVRVNLVGHQVYVGTKCRVQINDG